MDCSSDLDSVDDFNFLFQLIRPLQSLALNVLSKGLFKTVLLLFSFTDLKETMIMFAVILVLTLLLIFALFLGEDLPINREGLTSHMTVHA